MEPSDEHLGDLSVLMRRVTHGDERAFDGLYSAVHPRLVGLAMTILGDRQDCEDVAHDVLTYAWDHADRYHSDRGDALTWLFVITHRRAVDRRRAERRIRDKHALAFEVIDSPAPSAEDQVVTREEHRLLTTGLRSLTDIQRRSVFEVYYCDRTHPEAADRLGVPLPTFKSRIQGAIQSLQRTLAPAMS